MTPGIRPLVAGNWKMNGTSAALNEVRSIVNGFSGGLDTETDALLCFPATLLSRAADILAGSPVKSGGQDCHANESGAHTGDVSAEMLADAGASFVIVGHSERRADHGETSKIVAAKAKAVWRAGLTAIICIGETETERREGRTLEVIGGQLDQSVPDGASSANTIIAYEPVWAIGTGLTPTAGDVEAVHAHIRQSLSEAGLAGADRMRLVYGGSVKPGNAVELMGVANVDGALVGGASLKAGDFLGIAEAYRSL